jgi:hypothetical protein
LVGLNTIRLDSALGVTDGDTASTRLQARLLRRMPEHGREADMPCGRVGGQYYMKDRGIRRFLGSPGRL